MANADLRRMRDQSYKEFLWKPIAEGFPEPWTDSLLDTYRSLIARGVFYPGLHGFTHFNESALMAALQDSGARGNSARLLAENDIAYLASITPEYNFALACSKSGDDGLRPLTEQAEWLSRGIELFKRTFGFSPVTFCAPGYRADHTTRQEAVRLGLRVIQAAGRQMSMDDRGCLVTVRNVSIEPALESAIDMPSLMTAAHRAVVAGLPIVICTHSINYITRFNGRAEESVSRLVEMIKRLLDRYPNLGFCDDGRFERWVRSGNGTAFGRPDAGQVGARLRYFASV
jgi:hypothetical protein